MKLEEIVPGRVQAEAHNWLEERRGLFTISELLGTDGQKNHILQGTWDEVVSWFLGEVSLSRASGEPVRDFVEVP